MGQRMRDEPIEYGDDCAAGWAPGKTPKYVYVRFSLIEKCPDPALIPPNDRLFKLTQDEFTPCDWTYDRGGWRVEYQVAAAPNFIWVTLTDTDAGTTHFESTFAGQPEEGKVYDNDNLVCDAAHDGTDGIAVVTWSPQATQLLEDLNITKGDDLFMELFPIEDGKLVYKFCRIRESINIKCLFDPEA